MTRIKESQVLVRSMSYQYKEAKTREKVDSKLSEESDPKVGIHQGSLSSTVPFTLEADGVTEFEREGAISEMLYIYELPSLIKQLRDL